MKYLPLLLVVFLAPADRIAELEKENRELKIKIIQSCDRHIKAVQKIYRDELEFTELYKGGLHVLKIAIRTKSMVLVERTRNQFSRLVAAREELIKRKLKLFGAKN